MNWFQQTNWWLSGHDVMYALFGLLLFILGGIQNTVNLVHTPHLMALMFILYSLLTAWIDTWIANEQYCPALWSHGCQLAFALGVLISSALTSLDTWDFTNLLDCFMILTLGDCVLCRIPVHGVTFCRVLIYRPPVPVSVTELSPASNVD